MNTFIFTEQQQHMEKETESPAKRQKSENVPIKLVKNENGWVRVPTSTYRPTSTYQPTSTYRPTSSYQPTSTYQPTSSYHSTSQTTKQNSLQHLLLEPEQSLDHCADDNEWYQRYM